ncbi:unnamed protein product, partial [Laminaria digitata]
GGGGGGSGGGGEKSLKGGGNNGGGGYTIDEQARGGTSWVLRSECSTAGDGGVVCSACVPSSALGDRGQPRMLITGGKDSVLREWRVEHGQPRLVAEIAGHSDWISGCALVPSTTPGAPPSLAVSGGRDGSVRFWYKSAAAAAAAAAVIPTAPDDTWNEKKSSNSSL